MIGVALFCSVIINLWLMLFLWMIAGEKKMWKKRYEDLLFQNRKAAKSQEFSYKYGIR